MKTPPVIVRYTVMRLMIFFACLLLFWLLGLRGDDQQVLLLVLSAVVSLVISYFFLRRDRDTMSDQIAERLERRTAQRSAGIRGEDEDAEDAELRTVDPDSTWDDPR